MDNISCNNDFSGFRPIEYLARVTLEFLEGLGSKKLLVSVCTLCFDTVAAGCHGLATISNPRLNKQQPYVNLNLLCSLKSAPTACINLIDKHSR